MIDRSKTEVAAIKSVFHNLVFDSVIGIFFEHLPAKLITKLLIGYRKYTLKDFQNLLWSETVGDFRELWNIHETRCCDSPVCKNYLRYQLMKDTEK